MPTHKHPLRRPRRTLPGKPTLIPCDCRETLPHLLPLALACVPGFAETRSCLRRINSALGSDYRATAAILGSSPETVRDWVSGQRHPPATVRKHIWVTFALVCAPERLTSLADLLTCGISTANKPTIRRHYLSVMA